MKKIVVILFTVIFTLLISCKKDPETPAGGNKILIGATMSDTVSYIFAKVSTQLSGIGGNQITQHGHCWSTESSPDIEDSHNSLGGISTPGKFTSDLSGLSDNTKYFIRSYVTGQGGTIYGIQNEIITLKRGKPIANTGVTSDLTTSSVKISGSATFDSGFTITQKGICWDTLPNPTLLKSIGHSEEGAGIGSFISSVANLIENKHYYYCAYAINEKGTAYGAGLSFQTGILTLPAVTTSPCSNVTLTSATCGGNVTNAGNGAVSARGVCWNTTGNPTLANSLDHTTNGTGTGEFTSSINGLNKGTTYFVTAYATNEKGTTYGDQVSFTTPVLTCGSSFTINHVAGAVAPVTKSVTYGTITNIPGEPLKCWITSNLGADHQAISVGDATEASAGWYWQFNRKQGYKHDGTTRTPNTTWITSISETSDWITANDPCTIELGAGWRIPTNTEWTNVDASGGWVDWNGPWNSGLKLHAAGYLSYSDGSLNLRGPNGLYWSSSQIDATNGWYLSFSSGFSNMYPGNKATGISARCVRDY